MAEMFTENIHSGVKCKILGFREPTPEEYDLYTTLNVSRLIDGAMMTKQEYALAFGEVDVNWPCFRVCWGAWNRGLCLECGEVASPMDGTIATAEKWRRRKCKQCGPNSRHTETAETDTSPQRVCQWCFDCDLSCVEYTNLDGFPEPADLEHLKCRFFSHNEVVV